MLEIVAGFESKTGSLSSMIVMVCVQEFIFPLLSVAINILDMVPVLLHPDKLFTSENTGVRFILQPSVAVAIPVFTNVFGSLQEIVIGAGQSIVT